MCPVTRWHFVFALVIGFSLTNARAGQAQNDAPQDAAQRFDAAMQAEPRPESAPKSEPAPKKEESIKLLELAQQGGIFMYPIYGFSFIVVLFAIERALGLRRRKVIPPELVRGFGDLADAHGRFDPRKAYRLCQQFPSTASNVIRSVLLKIGRPHTELEQAVAAANEREAAKLYNNIRPLNLAATAGPLLGLLGTVQGMIIAFHDTAYLPPGVNKAEFLAKGVYIALVTTFAGLCVAIPAVCIAHFFEGKIQRLFAEIDGLLVNVLPQLERYEGKLRVTHEQLSALEAQRAPQKKESASGVRQPEVGGRKSEVGT